MTAESRHLCHHPGFGFCSPRVEAPPSILCVRVREEVGVSGGSWRREHSKLRRLAGSGWMHQASSSMLAVRVQMCRQHMGWLVWLSLCKRCGQKAALTQRENIPALACPFFSLESVPNRSSRGWKVLVLSLRRCRWDSRGLAKPAV